MAEPKKIDPNAAKWRTLMEKQKKQADADLVREIEIAEKRNRTAFARSELPRYTGAGADLGKRWASG